MRNSIWCVLGFGLLGACSRTPKADAPQPSAAAPVAPPAAGHVPTFSFVPPQAWQSKKEGVPPVEPPDMAQETWRALVNQNDPIQFETPRWQPLPASETVELKMRPNSRYRCVVTPLQVEAAANGFQTKFKAWKMRRALLCSADDFLTWHESSLFVRVNADGTREAGPNAGALLRQWDQKDPNLMVHTTVVMRSDKQRLEATVGPPQILTNVPFVPDDDD